MERDTDEVIDDLRKAEIESAQRGRYDLAALLSEAAEHLQLLDDRLESAEESIAGDDR